MRGQFILGAGLRNQKPIVLPNTVLDQGESDFLKILFQGNDTIVPLSGGNFYIGLMGLAYDETYTLASIGTEPSAAGGYARKALARNTTDWGTPIQQAGRYTVLSKEVTFTASGADFSVGFYRLFLCNVLSGTSGRLFAVSAALAASKLIIDGESYPVQYQFFLD